MKNNIKNFESLIDTWLDKNKVPLPHGRPSADKNAQGRSVEEMILELDEIANIHVFFVALYQSWRNRPTRRQNEELKTVFRRISETANISTRLLYAIDLQCINTNKQYALENQRLIIDTFKSKGIRAVEELYDKNEWNYDKILIRVLKGLERERIFKKEHEGGSVSFEKNDKLFSPIKEPLRWSSTTITGKEAKEICKERIDALKKEIKEELKQFKMIKLLEDEETVTIR